MLHLVPDSATSFFGYTPPPRVAPDLGRAFAEACSTSIPEAYDKLHSATVSLVHRLKDDGLPPERVIVAMKTAIVRYGGAHTAPSLFQEGRAEDRSAAAYRGAFAWFLDAYYNDA